MRSCLFFQIFLNRNQTTVKWRFFFVLSFVSVSYLCSPVSPAPPQVGELHRFHPAEAAVRALLARGRRHPRRAAASGHRGLGPVRLAFRAFGGANIKYCCTININRIQYYSTVGQQPAWCDFSDATACKYTVLLSRFGKVSCHSLPYHSLPNNCLEPRCIFWRCQAVIPQTCWTEIYERVLWLFFVSMDTVYDDVLAANFFFSSFFTRFVS